MFLSNLSAGQEPGMNLRRELSPHSRQASIPREPPRRKRHETEPFFCMVYELWESIGRMTLVCQCKNNDRGTVPVTRYPNSSLATHRSALLSSVDFCLPPHSPIHRLTHSPLSLTQHFYPRHLDPLNPSFQFSPVPNPQSPNYFYLTDCEAGSTMVNRLTKDETEPVQVLPLKQTFTYKKVASHEKNMHAFPVHPFSFSGCCPGAECR